MKVFVEIFAKLSILATYVILIYIFLVNTSEERNDLFNNSISEFIKSNLSNLNNNDELIFNIDENISFKIKRELEYIKVTSNYFDQPETLFNSYKNKAQEMCIYMNRKINKNKDFDIKNCDDYIGKNYFYI